jgi:alkanesulfonate monooxygenase SsuD/methylene tetrahydromethanopterin reductase-like flavin-dependent oxidoreductase (luciferase family)
VGAPVPAALHHRCSEQRSELQLVSGRGDALLEGQQVLTPTFGVVFSGDFPLQRTLEGAVLAERLGYDACWLGEDFFYHGGIATATAVAERTERFAIGLGVLSPLPRHPALTAMEVATLDEIARGRLIVGVGNGVPAWMRQMRLMPKSPLSAMREGVELCRRLIAGDTVTFQGACFSLDQVKLGFTPHRAQIPMYLGVEGPKGMELSGEIADGTVISVLAGPRYVRWAREHISTGRNRGTLQNKKHDLVVYVIVSINDDGAKARNDVRRTLAEYVGVGGPHELTRQAGIDEEKLLEMNRIYMSGRLPVQLVDDNMVDRLAVAGTPAECELGIRGLIDAGADQIVFFPFPTSEVEQQLTRIHDALLPRLTGVQHVAR